MNVFNFKMKTYQNTFFYNLQYLGLKISTWPLHIILLQCTNYYTRRRNQRLCFFGLKKRCYLPSLPPLSTLFIFELTGGGNGISGNKERRQKRNEAGGPGLSTLSTRPTAHSTQVFKGQDENGRLLNYKKAAARHRPFAA